MNQTNKKKKQICVFIEALFKPGQNSYSKIVVTKNYKVYNIELRL